MRYRVLIEDWHVFWASHFVTYWKVLKYFLSFRLLLIFQKPLHYIFWYINRKGFIWKQNYEMKTYLIQSTFLNWLQSKDQIFVSFIYLQNYSSSIYLQVVYLWSIYFQLIIFNILCQIYWWRITRHFSFLSNNITHVFLTEKW